jgi:spermidine/putrescine transport system ATP-binding protein
MEFNKGNTVEMRDVVKLFPSPEGGEVRAVDHINLQIRQGEFFSLLGPSGCGKTTSLRMIAGFEWPTEGEIYIDGQAMGRNPPFLRPVNTVFQSYALFQHMTVYQNVSFGLEMEKIDKSEIKQRVGEALEMVQMGNLGGRKPKQLSGGQQQRVALARALVKRPAVLLLDEPLGALDLKLRKEMQLELKALQMQVGITFVYVTHDQGEALTMSDRIAVMNKGQVLQIGTPVEIYERPRKRFVADFIGESNFLSGTVRSKSEDQVSVFIQDFNEEVIGLPQDNLELGQTVVVSIRPEKIRLSDKQVFNHNCIRGTVVNSVYVGSDTSIIVEVKEGVRLKVLEQNKISTLDPKAYFYKGQEVWVVLFPENTTLLAAE